MKRKTPPKKSPAKTVNRSGKAALRSLKRTKGKASAAKKKPRSKARESHEISRETEVLDMSVKRMQGGVDLVQGARTVYELRPAGERQSLFLSGLLDRVRMCWLRKNWRALAQMDLCEFEDHPQRGMIALFVSMGLNQVGNQKKAKEYLRVAMQSGCDPNDAVMLISASAHGVLANIHSLFQRPERSVHHRAIVAGFIGEDASALVDRDEIKSKELDEHQSRRRLIDLRCRRERISGRKLLVIGGMRHSGSTALFNIVRLAFEKSGRPYFSGYSEREETMDRLHNSDLPGVIKTHELRGDILHMAGQILTSQRDLRDSVASAARRNFPLYVKMGSAEEYAKHNRALYEMWARHSDFEFVYESFIESPLAIVRDVLAATDFDESLAEEITAEVLCLPTDQYDITLLSPQHITDPSHQVRYHNTLTEQQITAIQSQHFDWLSEHGYPLG